MQTEGVIALSDGITFGTNNADLTFRSSDISIPTGLNIAQVAAGTGTVFFYTSDNLGGGSTPITIGTGANYNFSTGGA